MGSGWSQEQACVFQFWLRELTSRLCSATASAVCFEDFVAGLEASETGNDPFQLKFEFTSLLPAGESRVQDGQILLSQV